MKLTIILSISTCVCLIISGLLYLVTFLLKKIWKVEEFIGSFWKGVFFVARSLDTLGIFLFCGAVISGLVFLISSVIINL